MTYTRHQPPAGLSGFLRLIWPLIYLQLMALKAWVRKHYGPGVPYWYEISRWGIVRLKHMPMDFTRSFSANATLQPAAYDFSLSVNSPRLARAMADVVIAEPSAPVFNAREYSVHTLLNAVRFDTS